VHTAVQQDGSSVRLSISPVAIASTRHSVRARRELTALCESWKQTQGHGGRIVEILGVPGSGKSRLLAAFGELFGDEPARFFVADCRDRNLQPFAALKSMLRAEGKSEAAADQARIAALSARQYAQNAWLREICREFDLPIPAGDVSAIAL
jgi:hypothetical protein